MSCKTPIAKDSYVPVCFCRFTIPFVFLLFCSVFAVHFPVSAEPIAIEQIEARAASISEALLSQTVADLVSFQTRYAKSENCRRAAYYLSGRLAEYGYRPRLHRFADEPGMVNVIADLEPEEGANPKAPLIVIGAHYDSTSEIDPMNDAPGADDNGSGVAAVLEVARIFGDRRPAAPIRFIFFSAEELGLKGAKAYVKDELADETRPILFLNPDYIGSGLPERFGTVVLYDKKSAKLAKIIEETGKANLPDLTILPVRSEMLPSWGDYKPFWDAGFRAVMFVREADLKSDYQANYHSPTDLPEHIRFEQVALVARLIYLTAEKLAQ